VAYRTMSPRSMSACVLEIHGDQARPARRLKLRGAALHFPLLVAVFLRQYDCVGLSAHILVSNLAAHELDTSGEDKFRSRHF
jgi:hypothetical protein